MAKIFKHLGLGNEKQCPENNKKCDNGEINGKGRYRKINSYNPAFQLRFQLDTAQEDNSASYQHNKCPQVIRKGCVKFPELNNGSTSVTSMPRKIRGGGMKRLSSERIRRASENDSFLMRSTSSAAASPSVSARNSFVPSLNSKPINKVVLLEDYSDPIDAIRPPIGQSDIYSDPADCNASSNLSLPADYKFRDDDDIYDLPPDDDYTDPYEGTSATLIRPEASAKEEDPQQCDKKSISEVSHHVFSYLDDQDSSSVIYDLPPASEDPVGYDVPPAQKSESVVYDMPWEWSTGAHLRSGLNIIGDRTSLSSHGSSGSQNSVGSAGSSSSGGRKRQVYETAFDSVIKHDKCDDTDRKIQSQIISGENSHKKNTKTAEKHKNKVLVNITPKDKNRVTLVRNEHEKAQTQSQQKPGRQVLQVKAIIEHNTLGFGRPGKERKPKHHSFSDFDQLQRKIKQNGEQTNSDDVSEQTKNNRCQQTYDVKHELMGVTDVMVKTVLGDSKKLNDAPHVEQNYSKAECASDDDYELPWDFKQAQNNLEKMVLDPFNNCDMIEKKSSSDLLPHDSGKRLEEDYEKPWDLQATQNQLKNLGLRKAGDLQNDSKPVAGGDVDSDVCSTLTHSANVDGLNANIASKVKDKSIILNNGVPKSLPANHMLIFPVSDSSTASNFDLKSQDLPLNDNSVDLSLTGAVPKINKDSFPPIARPKMTLDFNQSSRRPRQNLNLNFGCSALSAIGENIDQSLPLEQQGWYHGSISRIDAENLLRMLKEGSYLVRNSESCKQDYSLSLKSAKGFMHMKIVNKNNKFILGQFSKPFNSIPEMIQHYAMNKLPIRGAEHMSLLHPVIDQLL